MTDAPHLRTSERRDFKRCQQRWSWRWRKGLVLRNPKPGPLWFGTGIHLALEHRYSLPGIKRGADVLKTWRDYVGGTQAVIFGDNYADDKEDFYDAAELGEIMLGAYLDHYGKDERWHIIAPEQTFEIPIPHPRRDGTLVLYNGTFDIVALDLEAPDKSLWLWDHKTAKTIQTSHLALDDQAGSYWAIAADVLGAQGLVKPGMKLEGIMYNFLRKSMPDTRPRNAQGFSTNKPIKAHFEAALSEAGIVAPKKSTLAELQQLAEDRNLTVIGEVSKTQPTPNFLREVVWRTRRERRTQIQRIQHEALQMEALRRRQLPLIKNPTKDCSWDCDFFGLCQLHEQGDDWQEYRDLAYVKLDPYTDHRKSTED